MEFSNMIGKTLASIEGASEVSERLVFNFADGTAATSYHSQECCESVDIHRVTGDIASIIGSPITWANEDHPDEPSPNEYEDSFTWTRQVIRTASGEVVINWLGRSNGYYGETPYFQITHGTEV